jgi:hypothetical protein
MKKYREEKDGSSITIWEDAERIGLKFEEGTILQLYTAVVIVKNENLLTTEDGQKHIQEVEEELTEYAKERYPKEFTPIDNTEEDE